MSRIVLFKCASVQVFSGPRSSINAEQLHTVELMHLLLFAGPCSYWLERRGAGCLLVETVGVAGADFGRQSLPDLAGFLRDIAEAQPHITN